MSEATCSLGHVPGDTARESWTIAVERPASRRHTGADWAAVRRAPGSRRACAGAQAGEAALRFDGGRPAVVALAPAPAGEAALLRFDRGRSAVAALASAGKLAKQLFFGLTAGARRRRARDGAPAGEKL